MSDLRCASTLVEAADRDVEVVLLMLEHRGGSDEVFGFRVQQAAEKLLKAWLAIRGRRYPHTHDLQGLLNLLAEGTTDLDEFGSLSEYTPFAVVHRYEALGASEPPIERQQAASCIGTLLRHVRGLLHHPENA